MTMMTVTVSTDQQIGAAKLVLPEGDAVRLGLADGQTVTLEVQAIAAEESIVVSDADFAAMKAEIAALAERDTRGGTSPTLERLVHEAETRGQAARV